MARSTLHNLFSADQDDDEGDVLSYAAPKQPRPKAESNASAASASATESVLKASTVTAYRLVDGQYQAQGKLGIALLLSAKNHSSRIIFYVSRDKILAIAPVHVNFSFSVTSIQPPYASLYDSNSQVWSVLFDSEATLVEFARCVCLAKFLCSDGSGILTQDIIAGEGPALQTGDSAELRYTGMLIEDNAPGRTFDSSGDRPFRMKVGAKKVIAGWEEGVLSMRKEGRRILVVPPGKGYGERGAPGRIPAHAVLLFDLQVLRIKSKGRSEPEKPSRHKPADSPPLPVLQSAEESEEEEEEASVKQRTRSIAEKLGEAPSPPARPHNSKLIARMAKIGGQSVLPPKDGVGEIDRGHVSPQETAPPTPTVQAAPTVQQPTPTVQQQTPTVQQPSVPPSAFEPYAPQFASPQFPPQFPAQQFAQPQFSPYGPQTLVPFQRAVLPFPYAPAPQEEKKEEKTADVHTAMLVSETRQQNTEVRVAISKLQDKVDNVWARLNELKMGGSQSFPSLDSGTLLHNLTRIIEDNERLKQEAVQQSAKIEAQNEKMAELLRKNQGHQEASNRALEAKNEDFKAAAEEAQQRVLQLEQDKLQLTKQLSASTAEVTRLQSAADELGRAEKDMKARLAEASTEVEALREETATLKIAAAEARREAEAAAKAQRSERDDRRQTEQKLEASEEACQALERRLAALEQSSAARTSALEEEAASAAARFAEERAESERQLEEVRAKLRELRASTFSERAEEMNKMEEELAEQWRSKSERLVRAERERLERQLRAAEEEKARAEADSAQLEARIDLFRAKALEMKQRFKEEVTALKDELEEAKAREPGKEEVAKEVRRVMNQVFHGVRVKIEASRRYRGERVLQLLKGTIKRMTLRMMGQEVSSSEEEEENEEDEEVQQLRTQLQGAKERYGELQASQQQQLHSLALQHREELHSLQLELQKQILQERQAMFEQVKAKEEMLEQARDKQEQLQQARVQEEMLQQARANEEKTEQARANEEMLEEARLKEKMLEEARVQEEILQQARANKEMLEQARANEEMLEQARANEEMLEQARANEEMLEQARANEEMLEQARANEEMLEQARLKEKEMLEEAKVQEEMLQQARANEEMLEQARANEEMLEQARLKEEMLEEARANEEVLEQARANAEMLERAREKEDMLKETTSDDEAGAHGVEAVMVNGHEQEEIVDKKPEKKNPEVMEEEGDGNSLEEKVEVEDENAYCKEEKERREDEDDASSEGRKDKEEEKTEEEGGARSESPPGRDMSSDDSFQSPAAPSPDLDDFDMILAKTSSHVKKEKEEEEEEEEEEEKEKEDGKDRPSTNERVPLFGDDSDDDDYNALFGGKDQDDSAPPPPPAPPRKEDVEDKPKPPPLFDDDDDDDDFELFK